MPSLAIPYSIFYSIHPAASRPDAGLILHGGSRAIMTLEEPVQMILAIYRTVSSSKFLAQRSACI